MTREEAINEIKSWDFLNEEESKALQTLIPELAESEDERIIKKLQEYVKNRNWPLNGPTQAEVLAWLEKQKDINCLACDQHLKGYLAGRKVTEEEKQKEQKPAWSEEDERMLARIIERGQSQIQMFDTGLLPEHIAWLKSLRPQSKETPKGMYKTE